MRLHTIVTALAVAFSVAAMAQAFDPGLPMPKIDASYYQGAEKAVFHVTEKRDEKGYLAILGNVNNYAAALKQAGVKDSKLVVVLNGDGLGMMTVAKDTEFNADARLATAIDEARAAGVEFNVCYRTLTGRKIPVSALHKVTQKELVPSGVAEAARLQAQGYRLVKP